MPDGAGPGVLVAVAHGSADPRAAATITELAAVARERSSGLDLRTAFLGHAPPSLPQVLGTVKAEREVTVLPLLLTAAYHSKADIPRMLARDAPAAGALRRHPRAAPAAADRARPAPGRGRPRRLRGPAQHRRGPRRGRLE